MRQTRLPAVGLVTHLTLPASPAEGGKPRGLRCAFLSDPHIAADAQRTHHGCNMSLNLARTAAEAAAMVPDVALLLGDIAFEQGCSGDYEQFRSLIDPLQRAAPVCLTLGNHDDRANFLRAFHPDSATSAVEKVIVIVEREPFRIILLDSLFRTDLVPGLLGKAQRDWLRDFLADAAPMITLVCVHHPLADGDTNLLDSARLWDILCLHSPVKAIVHGHDHAYRHTAENGVPVISLPAVGMPLTPGEALGWIEAHLDDEGGLLRFHAAGREETGNRPAEHHLVWRR